MAKDLKITGKDIAEILKKKKFKIKDVTNNKVTVMVNGDRVAKLKEIATVLSNLGAKVNKNLAQSSIGGVVVGDVKIFVKADGRSGNGLSVELDAINKLTTAVLNAVVANGGPITVKVGSRTVKGVCKVAKTDGTPKSDFHLADSNGRPLVHISHKKGSRPNDFQQWGGITETRIAADSEVQQFIATCKGLYGKQMPSGQSAYRKIKNKDLKMMSIFGVNYDTGGVDENKVDVLLQGDPGIKQLSNGVFELTATGHVHYHGDIPSGGFDPVLAVIYKGDRDQFDIKGARFSIYPFSGRNFKQPI
jgi:hypothetical protein